jgi:ketosteroid isomerase-like protein
VTDHEAVLRRSIEAWNEDDYETLETLWHPDGEIVPPEGWPEPATPSGWPAIREQFRRIKDSWTEERAVLGAVEPIGDRLLGQFRWSVRGDASGAPLQVAMWMLCEFDGGRFTRISYFLDERAARQAAEEGG